jgi:hypothetical protein
MSSSDGGVSSMRIMKTSTALIAILASTTGLLAVALLSCHSAEATTTSSVIQASDSGLSARLNAGTFTAEDTVIVNGTVEDREPNSYVAIQVIDPNSQRVAYAFPPVTADNTFRYSFELGPNRPLDNIYAAPIETPGNYRVTLQYQQPGEDLGSDDYFAETELVFAYNP